MKISSKVVLLCSFKNISISPRNLQRTLMCVNNKTLLFYMTILFSLLSNPYISNLSNLYNSDKIRAQHLKRYVTTCFQIRSRIIISMFFGYVLGLYCFSSCMWKFSTYSEDGKVLEYTVSLLPNESNRLHPEYYFPPNK